MLSTRIEKYHSLFLTQRPTMEEANRDVTLLGKFLLEEVEELAEAVQLQKPDVEIGLEIADIALFCMAIAWIYEISEIYSDQLIHANHSDRSSIEGMRQDGKNLISLFENDLEREMVTETLIKIISSCEQLALTYAYQLNELVILKMFRNHIKYERHLFQNGTPFDKARTLGQDRYKELGGDDVFLTMLGELGYLPTQHATISPTALESASP